MSSLAKENQPSLLRATSCSLPSLFQSLFQQVNHSPQKHEVLAKGVTLFQVAIAIAAISVLTQRRRFYFVNMGFGAIGRFLFIGRTF